jgi:uncharacterized protein (UPF0332 family)
MVESGAAAQHRPRGCPPVNIDELWGKAQQAANSARLLLNAADTSGACNRAYYAMFDAARAALLASGVGVAHELGKSHSGLIHSFSLHLVKPGLVPKELGQSLARAHELRLIADYTGDQVQLTDAQAAVDRAEQFIDTLKTRRFPAASS